METIPFDSIFIPLSAALGLSLIVERILELTNNILERLVAGADTPVIPSGARADDKLTELEQLHSRAKYTEEVEEAAEKAAEDRQKTVAKLESEQDTQTRKHLRRELQEFEKDGEWSEHITGAEVLVHKATDPDDGKTMKACILQLLGFAVGIVVVHFSGLQLFNSFLVSLNSAASIPLSIDYLFTGLLIGGSSAPMHVLVRFVTQRKIYEEVSVNSSEDETTKTATSQRKSEQGAVPEIVIPESKPAQEAESGINVPYRGGVDRDLLENVHVRPEDPNLVVYHHTAMHSESTFQDVVRVIKSRTDSRGNHWLTGYNCVILRDGSIHPFCRWDRYGNHAVGYNRRSLGIAFNGNFETDPNVPGSNPDGRFGKPHPSEEQIKSGARVITLWSLLYDIDLNFDADIIPHKQIATKACPGSGFYYDELKRWVDFYREKWDKSDTVQEELHAYKLKAFLYSRRRA